MELTSPLLSLLAGLVCGIISGFGIGGGSLLMVWMTAVVMTDQKIAQGINLLYFIPTSAAALFFHIKNKMIEWRVVLPAALFGCTAAILGSLCASILPVGLLHKLFGGFLCIAGIKEVLYNNPK